jgi:hypothetical protein
MELNRRRTVGALPPARVQLARLLVQRLEAFIAACRRRLHRH